MSSNKHNIRDVFTDIIPRDMQKPTLKQDISSNVRHLLSKKYIKRNFIKYSLHCGQKCPATLPGMVQIQLTLPRKHSHTIMEFRQKV